MVLASRCFGCFVLNVNASRFICGLYSQIHVLDVVNMATRSGEPDCTSLSYTSGSKAIEIYILDPNGLAQACGHILNTQNIHMAVQRRYSYFCQALLKTMLLNEGQYPNLQYDQ